MAKIKIPDVYSEQFEDKLFENHIDFRLEGPVKDGEDGIYIIDDDKLEKTKNIFSAILISK